MHSVQRQFGKLMNKSPGDNAKIAAVLHDYEDADSLLSKIIENTRTLRDAWVAMATSQWAIVKEYQDLYDPIVGASEGHARPSIETPRLQLNRTFKLSGAYSDLKDELIEEVTAIDSQVIRPATEAREFIQPLRKTIKKRENKRLDYEKAQEKVKKLQKKTGRTPKEEAQLSKVEFEMSCAAEEFEVADVHLRDALPPIIEAIFTLIPHLLASHVSIQNRLLGLYYTALHNYCQDHDFPSPPPPMEKVVSAWSTEFLPVQREVEAISCITHGKNWRQPAKVMDDGQSRKPSVSPASSRNGFVRTPSGTSESTTPTPRTMRIPSTTTANRSAFTSDSSPQPSPQSRSTSVSHSQLGLPTDFTTATALGQPQGASSVSPAYTSSRAEYFGHQSGIPSNHGSVLAKKKPPPPPPAKRLKAPEEYVVAQYDFSGGDGDLSFREGDRIRIIEKTETDQDWWMGELGGVKGSFPANYCKTA